MENDLRNQPSQLEVMQYSGTLESFFAIIDWMKGAGNTQALADEVIFSTPIIHFPSVGVTEVATPGDIVVRFGDEFKVYRPFIRDRGGV